tara:strand:+ start:1835 stop:1987 length:153 start_codon:yes stop_codon:yes gene_type:complete
MIRRYRVNVKPVHDTLRSSVLRAAVRQHVTRPSLLLQLCNPTDRHESRRD